MTDSKKDPSAVVVPFGKHKGATVAELLVKDPAYADWVMAQGWVAERFAELHAAIATRGAGTDDTPEHNALQARFLDAGFRAALLRVAIPKRLAKDRRETLAWDYDTLKSNVTQLTSSVENAEQRKADWSEDMGNWGLQRRAEAEATLEKDGKRLKTALEKLEAYQDGRHYLLFTSVEFEKKGMDVIIRWDYSTQAPVSVDTTRGAAIELKPAMGDDYPSVMRQMQRLGASICVVGQYTGRGVSETQLRQMFTVSGFTLVFVQEIEEEVRRAP